MSRENKLAKLWTVIMAEIRPGWCQTNWSASLKERKEMKSRGKHVGWWCVKGWPMQGAEEQVQQTVQTYPRSLTQQDHSQAVQETGKAVKEGIGGLRMAFWMRKEASLEDENRLFLSCLKKAGGRWVDRSARLCCCEQKGQCLVWWDLSTFSTWSGWSCHEKDG